MTYEQVIKHPLAQACSISERTFLKVYAETRDVESALQTVHPNWSPRTVVRYGCRLRGRKPVSLVMAMLDDGLEANEENVEMLAMIMAQKGDTPNERATGLKIAKQIVDERKAERADGKLKGIYKRDLRVLNNPPHRAKRSS